MLSFITGLLISAALLVGFPKLPPPEQLVAHAFAPCPSGALMEVASYQTQEKPSVLWDVFKDVNGKVWAIVVFVDEKFAKAYVLKGDKVLELNSFEELLKVSKSACDLLPKVTL